ncbi:hypothetical protein FA13DRAFT_1734980, partial [Coprinellus micaceus]
MAIRVRRSQVSIPLVSFTTSLGMSVSKLDGEARHGPPTLARYHVHNLRRGFDKWPLYWVGFRNPSILEPGRYHPTFHPFINPNRTLKDRGKRMRAKIQIQEGRSLLRTSPTIV